MSTRIEAAFVLSLAVRERAPTSGEREDLVIIITRWWSTCTVIWQFIQCIDCCCGNVFLIRKNCFFFGCCSCLFVVHRSLSRALMSVPDPLSLTDLLVILIHILYQQPRPLPSDASHTGASSLFLPSSTTHVNHRCQVQMCMTPTGLGSVGQREHSSELLLYHLVLNHVVLH